ncbi:Synaptotagmin-1 [Hondaea fermentalgiana]|uniref:Synaptotagmin-1 n=1 Tax=Hondaea fermentalgiana TaxID=2315210 RepID=A0A2R5GS68_9STRA|nr:Synaptotagmin-1 [Hondaea fermentalgiana]|eukprot:GBG33149.1 Synaptotagmin-1 [Hondaea fermentalgiana]
MGGGADAGNAAGRGGLTRRGRCGPDGGGDGGGDGGTDGGCASPPPAKKQLVAGVEVLLRSAEGLPAADSNGLSDPYVVLRVGRLSERKSKIRWKTLDPVWDEEHFLAAPPHTAMPLEVEVRDMDMLSSECLGRGEVDISWLDASRGPVELTVELKRPTTGSAAKNGLAGRSAGKVKLQVRRGLRPAKEMDGLARSQDWVASNRRQRIAVVELVKGQNLVARDDNGYSDAYVCLELAGITQQSRVVARSLHPKWRERFEFNFAERLRRSLRLKLEGNAVYLRDDGLLETRFNDEDTEAVIQQTMDTFGLEENFDANEALRTSASAEDDPDGSLSSRKAYFRAEAAERAAEKSHFPSSPSSGSLSLSSSSSSLSPSMGRSPRPLRSMPSQPSLGRLEQISSMSMASIPEAEYSDDEFDSDEDDLQIGYPLFEGSSEEHDAPEPQRPQRQRPPAQAVVDQDAEEKKVRKKAAKSLVGAPSSLTAWGQRQVVGWLKFGLSVAKNSYLVAMAKDSFIGDAVRELIATHAPKLMLLQDGDVLNRPFLEQLRMLSRLGKQFQDQLEFVASSTERTQNLANWTVPTLSMIVFLLLLGATIALLLLPWNICLMLAGYGAVADTWVTKYLQRDQYTISRSRWLEFLSRVPSDVDRAKCKPLSSLMPDEGPPPSSRKLARNYSEEVRQHLSGIGERILRLDRYAARKRATS